jgi:hypothetical protein
LDSTDYTGINNVLLPLLRQYDFDFHLNGHEHFIAYAYLLKDTPLTNGAYLPGPKHL